MIEDNTFREVVHRNVSLLVQGEEGGRINSTEGGKRGREEGGRIEEGKGRERGGKARRKWKERGRMEEG